MSRPLQSPDIAERYVGTLCGEISHPERAGWKRGRTLCSIFFGGGTPSLIEPYLLEKILGAAKATFSLDPNAEVTLEANPETVTRERALAWKRMGFNRVSLGVQTLNDSELVRLGRVHNADRAETAFRDLRDIGFENLSIDLMFGLEGQTIEAWTETLRRAVEWRPEHVSAYNLTIEEGTRFGDELRRGKLTLPDEESQLRFFEAGTETLAAAGYLRYEISNYAKPGYECQHNLLYWSGREYWGTGLGAHSFQRTTDGFRRFWNSREVAPYTAGEIGSEELLTTEMHLGERLMTDLRLTRGISFEGICAEIGIAPPTAVRTVLDGFCESGHLSQVNGVYRLTKSGLPVSDSIFAALLPTSP